MNITQFLLILKSRWKLAFSVFFGLVALVMAITFIIPPTFEANADVVIDVKSPDPVAGIYSPAMALPGYMATQIDIIESRRVALGVIERMKLDTAPQVVSDWKDDTDGIGDIKTWLVDNLSKHLDVAPSRESNLISIGYQAADPQFAAAMANAYAASFMAITLEMKVSPAGQNAAWFKEQVATLKAAMDAAQTKVTDFRKEKSLTGDAQARADAEITRLNDLAVQLTGAQAQDAESQSKRGPQNVMSLPEVLQNPLVQSLRMQVADAQSKLSDASVRLGQNHPEYKRLKVQAAEAQAQLNSQIARVTAGISVTDNQGAKKVDLLKQALDEQKAKVVGLNADLDQLGALQHELDMAEKAYQSLSERFMQSDLQSQSSSTNVLLLTPAVPPIKQASPKIALNAVLAVFMGFVVAIAAVVLAEMSDRRVRGEDDFQINFGMPLPLLGIVPNVAPLKDRSQKAIGRRKA